MATEICIQLGRRILELRRQRGWRHMGLVAHAELNKTHVNELEKGKREIGLNALERLAAALDVKVSGLLKAIGQ